MKKTLLLTALFALTSLSTMAMSRTKIRNNARYLTDRMAYELDFTPKQYDDCYEINYDFIYSASTVMDDVVRGYYDAIDAYYRYLDLRNEDLTYVMTAAQYIRFMSKDYFYRPIYSTGSTWEFRIYTTYSNRNFFYFDAPSVFKDYRGGHSRTHYTNGYYNNHYSSADRFSGHRTIVGSKDFSSHRKNDFGSNLRNRNEKPYNNYSNRNSSNRTGDSRYRDNSGNQNTPLINQRSSSGSVRGEHRGASNNVEHRGAPSSSSSTSTSTSTHSSRGGLGTSTQSTRGTRK